MSRSTLGLRKFENPGKHPWEPLEGTHTLILRSSEADKGFFPPQISESGPTLPAES